MLWTYAAYVSFFLDEFKINKELNKWNERDNLRRILKNYYNPHEALKQYLEYAVFTVRDVDWPQTH
jgi:hypothetical protein